jgi:hypothetical protein
LEKLVLDVLELLSVACDRCNVLKNQLPCLSLARTAFTSQHQRLILAPVFQTMPSSVCQGINVRGEFTQTVASISVDHLRGVQTELLVRVDGDEDGGHPGVDLIPLEPVIKVLNDSFLGAGIVVGEVGAT